jgi:hypothetical protein
MQVPGLGDALAEPGLLGEAVALDDGHPPEALGEHTRGQKTGHATADDQGVSAPVGRRVRFD